jgi:hypothetical protein
MPSKFGRFVLFALFFLRSNPVFAFSDKKPFDIAADAIEFIDDTKEMVAEGHVVVIQGSSTLKSDYLHFDRLNRRLVGHGNVILRENSGLLTGESLDYDLATETANLTDPKAYAAPWFFQGGTWEKRQDYYVGRDGAFTSCELPDAHYFFRARRIHYVPNERFWAWSTKMYVDGVPVLYMPFVQKPLGPQRITFQAQPGNDSANGAFARTTTTLRYTDKVYQKILADYYSNVGNGFGTELDYQPTTKMKGSFFGYYIKPKAAPDIPGAPIEAQYNIRSYHFQRLSDQYTLQSNVNLRKNVSFNNLFYRQDNNQGVNDVLSSIALTQQNKKINQHLVMEVDQSPDPNADPLFADTHIQTASLPRYDFTLYQIPLWSPKRVGLSSDTVGFAPGVIPLPTTGYAPGQLTSGATTYATFSPPPLQHVGPINLTLNGGAGEFYSRLDERTRTKLNTGAGLTQAYVLNRSLTLTPGLNTQVRWQDLNEPQPAVVISTFTSSTTTLIAPPIPINQRRGAQGLGGASLNLHYRVSRSFTFDQNYNLTLRSTPNAFKLDRSQVDGGVDSHHVTWILVGRPSQSLLFRSQSGYDLRHIEYEAPDAYRQRRIDAWTNQLDISPRGMPYTFNFTYALGYYPTRDLSWEATGRYTGIHKTLISSSFLYNRGLPGQITWNNTVGFYFSPGWRMDTQINMYVPGINADHNAGQVGKIIDNQFIVVREIHCWEIQFIFRNRPPISREYSILANLKFGPTTPRKIEDKELETQFYPWRAGAYAN